MRTLAPSLLLVALLGAFPAFANPGAQPTVAAAPESAALGSARTPIQGFYASLSECMKAGATLDFEGRRAKLAPVVDGTFDLPLMAAKVLGRHWQTLSPADQKRWQDAFAALTVKTYAERFAEDSGLGFEIDAVQAAPRGTALVRTRLVRPKQAPVAIDYRMRPDGASWRVIDIFLNGTVSELALRRSEYSSVVERDGFEALVSSLRSRSLVRSID